MKGKNIIITALAVTLLTACKDKTYKPPTLDAMRSADKARAAWARETEEHSATLEIQPNRMQIPLLWTVHLQTAIPLEEIQMNIIHPSKKQKNKRVWYYM